MSIQAVRKQEEFPREESSEDHAWPVPPGKFWIICQWCEWDDADEPIKKEERATDINHNPVEFDNWNTAKEWLETRVGKKKPKSDDPKKKEIQIPPPSGNLRILYNGGIVECTASDPTK